MDCNRLHKLAVKMHHRRFIILEYMQQAMNNVRTKITVSYVLAYKIGRTAGICVHCSSGVVFICECLHSKVNFQQEK